MLSRFLNPIPFEPELERAYRAAFNKEAAFWWSSLWISAIAYDAFLLTDVTLIPDMFWVSAIVRLGIVTPMILATIPLQRWAIQRDEATILPSVWLGLLGLVIFGSVMFLNAATRSPSAAEYFTGGMVVLICFNAIRLGRFADHVWSTVGMCVIFVCVMPWVTVTLEATKSDAILSLLTIATISIFGNRRTEANARTIFATRQQQQAFLDQERGLKRELADMNAQLRQASMRDPLTGIANRRSLDEELAAVRRRGRPAGILMIDVDHFKDFNDRYGHVAGDCCLVHVAKALNECVGQAGLVARYGGEEFMVLLPDAEDATLASIGAELRRAVFLLAIPHHDHGRVVVTVSIGAALWRPEAEDLAATVKAADEALYLSKRGGRNRVTFAKAEDRMPVDLIA